MRMLFVGVGVIGTIYGWALSESGASVTHCVRPGDQDRYADGIDLDVLDRRDGHPEHAKTHYSPVVLPSDGLADDYDLLVVATKHYQAADALVQIKDRVPSAKVLLFCGNWEGPQAFDALMPRSRYVWGYASSTGGTDERGVVANIRPAYRIGPLEGSSDALLQEAIDLFATAGFEPDRKRDMVEWLWVHHAISAGMIGTALACGGLAEMGSSDENMERMVLAVRDGIAVLAARGVDVHSWDDTKPFLDAPIETTIAQTREAFITSEWGKRVVASGHFASNPEEMRRIVTDVVTTGRELDVPMPVLGALRI